MRKDGVVVDSTPTTRTPNPSPSQHTTSYRSIRGLLALGVGQWLVWMAVAWLAGRFTAGIDLAERPLLPVVGLLTTGFILYLASLAHVWHRPPALTQARAQLRVIVMFAVVFRLTLWWTEPIQEVDLYRYLWDGRAWQAGVNPYRYSPAQVDTARESTPGSPEMERLVDLLRRSPEVASIFSRIEHRGVATIYPP